jgi:hypothetical protein
MPCADQEIRGPPEIPHNIKIRVSSNRERMNRTGFIARFRAIGSHTQIMVLYKNLSPSHNVDVIRAYLDTFPAGNTITRPVKPILSDRISEP